MTNRKDILTTLIQQCFFAPSHSRLATLLGQKGRMNITRLIDGTLGERAINTLWQDICNTFSVSEELMPYLPIIWNLCGQLKMHTDLLCVELPIEEQECPPSIDKQIWEEIHNLYRHDPMLCYMLMALLYAKRHGINPYQQKQMGATVQVIKEINEQLHQLFPEQINAYDAAKETIRVLAERDVDNWWWIGYFGGTILRLYHEPSYLHTMFREQTYAMPFPEEQWWRGEESDTLWYWKRNGHSNALYDVMRVNSGQDVGEAEHFQVIFTANHVARLLKQTEDKIDGVFLYWELTERKGIYSLTLRPETENETCQLLPERIVMLQEGDNPLLLARAKELTKDMQREVALCLFREAGLEPTIDYEIIDVECSRTTLKVIFKCRDTELCEKVEFSLSNRPALYDITAQSTVDLYIGRADRKLYAFWDEIGVLLAIDEL